MTLLDGSFHEGELKGRREVALALKQAGLLTAEQIAAVSGLALEQVRAL